MRDYLDASAIVPIVVVDAHRATILDHLAKSPFPPQVSDFAVAEVSSAISRLVRMRHTTPDQAAAALLDLDEWTRSFGQSIEVDPLDVREATLLVRRFDLKLRTPDALHLVICRRLGARMVTFDNPLAHAARAVAVACINPAENAVLKKD